MLDELRDLRLILVDESARLAQDLRAQDLEASFGVFLHERKRRDRGDLPVDPLDHDVELIRGAKRLCAGHEPLMLQERGRKAAGERAPFFGDAFQSGKRVDRLDHLRGAALMVEK